MFFWGFFWSPNVFVCTVVTRRPVRCRICLFYLGPPLKDSTHPKSLASSWSRVQTGSKNVFLRLWFWCWHFSLSSLHFHHFFGGFCQATEVVHQKLFFCMVLAHATIHFRNIWCQSWCLLFCFDLYHVHWATNSWKGPIESSVATLTQTYTHAHSWKDLHIKMPSTLYIWWSLAMLIHLL